MTIHWVKVEGREVALKRSEKSFRVIKPFRNNDGTLNWFNILVGGSWLNLIITIVIVFIVLGVVYEYSSNINNLLDCFRIPYQLQLCVETFGSEEVKQIQNLFP